MMEEIKLNIEAIRAQLQLPKPEMAERLGVTLDRYNRLARGESKMFATELVRLHELSGVPYENIAIIGN